MSQCRRAKCKGPGTVRECVLAPWLVLFPTALPASQGSTWADVTVSKGGER